MSEQQEDLIFFVGLVAGAVAGGIAAAILAPQSGEVTREQVVERGLVLKGRAEDVVQRAQQIAGDTVARVQSRALELLNRSGEPNSPAGPSA